MQFRASLHHPDYRPDIDGLRAIAVLSVVAYHAFPNQLAGGFIGVDIFFVISGYLISTIIFKSLEGNAFSFPSFYARRIKRIFPALIVVLTATLVFGWFVLLSDELSQLGKHAAAGAGFFSNFVLWGEVGYFDNAAETKPLLHLWSLSIEEQFYILWPLMVWLMWRWQASLHLFIAGLIILSFGINLIMVANDPVGAFFSPLSRFWELLCGALLAWGLLRKDVYATGFSTRTGIEGWSQEKRKRLRNAASVFGLLLIGYGLLEIEKDNSFPGYWALLPVLGTMVLIATGPDAWINRRILSTRAIVWFGLISFPLYLWHWPLLSFSQIIHAGTQPWEIRVLLILISIILSWLTLKFIEAPIRFSPQFKGLKVASLSACMLSIGLIGFAVGRTDFSATHRMDTVSIARPEFAFGSSLAWYAGKEDWLFLGNANNESVAKLKLAKIPDKLAVAEVHDSFAQVVDAAARSGITLALLVGPNKETIYPEFLPDALTPSPKRYSSYFIDSLRSVPGIILYDPTEDLRQLKATEGLLYWRTDTHWNSKGAYFAFAGLLKALDLPVPDLEFKQGQPRRGDLVDIADLRNFPSLPDNDWEPVWPLPPSWQATPSRGPSDPTFSREIIRNERPLLDKSVWVVGDSFAQGTRQYLNVTFREVHYLGHWKDTLAKLPAMLADAETKPDLIIVVRVERSF